MTMKKSLNVNACVDARHELMLAEKNVDYTRRYWPDDVDKAAAKRDAALEAVNEMLRPLKEAIDSVECKARVRCILADDVIRTLCKVDDALDIPKKAKVGIKVDADLCAQDFPNRYKGIPESTHFLAEYKTTGWVITDIYRGRTRRATQRVLIEHTEQSKESLIKRFSIL